MAIVIVPIGAATLYLVSMGTESHFELCTLCGLHRYRRTLAIPLVGWCFGLESRVEESKLHEFYIAHIGQSCAHSWENARPGGSDCRGLPVIYSTMFEITESDACISFLEWTYLHKDDESCVRWIAILLSPDQGPAVSDFLDVQGSLQHKGADLEAWYESVYDEIIAKACVSGP